MNEYVIIFRGGEEPDQVTITAARYESHQNNEQGDDILTFTDEQGEIVAQFQRWNIVGFYQNV